MLDMGHRRRVQPCLRFAFSLFGSANVTIHGYQTRYHPRNVKSSCSLRRKSALCQRNRRVCPVLFPFEEQTWFQLLDSEIINAKSLLKDLETNIGFPAESFERCMGEVDGGV